MYDSDTSFVSGRSGRSSASHRRYQSKDNSFSVGWLLLLLGIACEVISLFQVIASFKLLICEKEKVWCRSVVASYVDLVGDLGAKAVNYIAIATGVYQFILLQKVLYRVITFLFTVIGLLVVGFVVYQFIYHKDQILSLLQLLGDFTSEDKPSKPTKSKVVNK